MVTQNEFSLTIVIGILVFFQQNFELQFVIDYRFIKK